MLTSNNQRKSESSLKFYLALLFLFVWGLLLLLLLFYFLFFCFGSLGSEDGHTQRCSRLTSSPCTQVSLLAVSTVLYRISGPNPGHLSVRQMPCPMYYCSGLFTLVFLTTHNPGMDEEHTRWDSDKHRMSSRSQGLKRCLKGFKIVTPGEPVILPLGITSRIINKMSTKISVQRFSSQYFCNGREKMGVAGPNSLNSQQWEAESKW